MADESVYLGAGVVGLLMSQISAGVAQVPMLGSFAPWLIGLVMLGVAVWLLKEAKPTGVEGVGKLLVALGIGVTALAMLPMVSGFVAGVSSLAVAGIALGIILMYVKLAKRAI